MKVKLSWAMIVILILNSNSYSSQKLSEIMEEERYSWGEPYLKNFSDFRGWIKGFFFGEPPSMPLKEKRDQFEEAGRAFIEKISFFDKDIKKKFLEGKRFIVSQDADHPELLRSLSIWDSERKLEYVKEESIGKSGKKIYYFDPQADVSYWKKKGKWYVQAPYVFGYHKECYETREALEKRLHGLFEKRVNGYAGGDYEILPQGNNGFVIKKTKGFFVKQTLETTKASNIYEVHQFLLDRERDHYTSYLYEGEDPSAKFKGLGLIALMLGAGMVDGMNTIKWGSPIQDSNDKIFYPSQSPSTEGTITILDSLLFTTLTLATPKLLPLYFLMKASEGLGVKGQEVYCEDGVCGLSSCSQSSDLSCPGFVAKKTNMNYVCENLFDEVTYLDSAEISCKDNTVLLLGLTGSGKSTLLNYIAGKKLVAKKKGLNVEITVDDSVAEIGHGIPSKTFKPNFWKGESLCYYDTPGFSDTRGPSYDISKAFFLKQLGETVNSMRIVLVAEEQSMRDRAMGFTTLMKHLENFIGEEGLKQIQDSTSLIITKSNHPLTDIRDQLSSIKDDGSLNFSLGTKNLLKSILDQKRIRTFEEIKGEVFQPAKGENKEYVNLIKSTKTVAPHFGLQDQKKSLFKISISPETINILTSCSTYFNENIKKSVGSVGSNIQGHYADSIKKQAIDQNTVQLWHTSLKDFYDKELLHVKKPLELVSKMKDHVKSFNITDTQVRNTTFILENMKRQGENLDFLKTISQSIQYTPAEWVSGLNPAIKALKQFSDIFYDARIQKKEPHILIVKGYSPKMSSVIHEMNKHQGITAIQIYGLGAFYLDKNLILPGGNVTVITPHWITGALINGTVSSNEWFINLNGKNGESHTLISAENGKDGTGQNGKDGLPGKSGQNGGYFFGIGNQFFNLILNPSIYVNGGKGGDGQNGGKGGNGWDGSDADLSLFHYGNRKSLNVYEDKTDRSFWGSHQTIIIYYKDGEPGQKGGNGGQGGIGGKSGFGGKSFLINLSENKILTMNGKDGSVAKDGQAGAYGRGGETGRRGMGRYEDDMICGAGAGGGGCGWIAGKFHNKHHVNSYTTAPSGSSPLDKNRIGQEEPLPQYPINYAEVINEYKVFWRENFDQLNKPEYKDNIMIQAQKELLESFLQKLEIHPEVKKKVTS